jgi:NADH:ubiquinone oxidoreductase subunit 5 (subunit L)/multisubunit Na+/H+ antiporter MnhA subunit
MLAAVQLAVMSTSYWQLFVCAELVSVAAWRLLCSLPQSAGESAAERHILTWGLLSDLPLIVGLTALWQGFGTLDYAVILDAPPALDASGTETSHVMAGFAAFCLVAAGMARCAQFPCGHWLMAAATGRGAAACLVVCLGVLPLGVFLLLRSLPLLAAQPAALTLLGNWGCLSALVWGGVILTQCDLARTAAAFAAGTLGLFCMGLGPGSELGSAAALYLAGNLFLLTSLLLATVFLPDSSQEADGGAQTATPAAGRASLICRWLPLLVAVALASGVWGQEGILRALWTPAAGSETNAALTTEGPVSDTAPPPLPVAEVAGIAAHLLLSFGLFRTVLPVVRSSAAQAPTSDRPRLFSGLLVLVAAVAMPLAVGLCPQLVGVDPSGEVSVLSQLSPLWLPGMTALLMLLALLLAWLFNGRSSTTPQDAEDRFGSLVRLSQRQFYVPDVCRLGIALPLAVCGGAVRLLERHVWEQPLLRDPSEVSSDSPPDAAGHAPAHPAWPALCLCLATGIVLILLLRGG